MERTLRRAGSIGWLPLLLMISCAGPSTGSHLPTGVPTGIQTGVHFPRPDEYVSLKRDGADFAVVDFPLDQPGTWLPAIQRAAQSGLKLIAGVYPPPYRLGKDGTWTIEPRGTSFLTTLGEHPETVMAVFVYNEPYYSDPNSSGRQYDCGFYSAEDLRKLRATIRTVWPDARVYHDLGDPSVWAPGGEFWQLHQECLQNKYRDQTEIADFVGIWSYPFQTGKGYRKEQSLGAIRRELEFVNTSMRPAKPVVLGQAFASRRFGNYFPSKAELRDWNCSIRQIGTELVSWYPWRQQGVYDDYLANHPDYWPLAVGGACRG